MARQSIQFGGETWVRDGSWWVKAAALEPYGGDPDTAPPEVVEGNRVKYREGMAQKTIEERGGVKSSQKILRQGNISAYGDERGRAIAKQRLDWSREAEAMGADPAMVDFLYFQEGVLLPGGIVADYYTPESNKIRFQDLQGNIIPGTPELEAAARAKHIEVYGEKYGQTQTGGGPNPPAPPTPPGPIGGGGPGPSTPQMPGQSPPPPGGGGTPPTTQPTAAPGSGAAGTPGTTITNSPAASPGSAPVTRPAQPAPPAPPAPPGGSQGRSPYPGVQGLSEQPGLGGSAAPAPASTATGQTSATTPPKPGAGLPGRPSSGPVRPGLGATPGSPAGGGVTPGLGAPAPVSPPGAVAGGGAAGALPPATQPPPQPVPGMRSPYPTGQRRAAAPVRTPYPGVGPAAPPRTISMPAAYSGIPGVNLPQLQPGQPFFDPFTGKFL